MSDLSRREAIVLSAFAAGLIRSTDALAADDPMTTPTLDLPSSPPDPLSIPITVGLPIKAIVKDSTKVLTLDLALKKPKESNPISSVRLELRDLLLKVGTLRIGMRLKVLETEAVDREIWMSAPVLTDNPVITPASATVHITKATCAPPLVSTLRASVQPSYPKNKEAVTLKFMTPQPPLDTKNKLVWWVRQANVSYTPTGKPKTTLLSVNNSSQLLSDELFLSFTIDNLDTAGNMQFDCQTTTDGKTDKGTISFNIPIEFST